MVSTYPPEHCGIAAYAEQSVARLRSQGHTVDVVSPDGQGNVKFAWDLCGGTNILRLLRLLPDYDKVVIQYHWGFFYRDPSAPRQRWDRLKTTCAFLLLFLRSRKIEIVAHEIPYARGKQSWLYKWKWKLAPKIVFHTASELERFQRHYGMRLNPSRVEIRRHDEVYRKFAEPAQFAARSQLQLPRNQTIFLCIGFIQRHKGFHRAIEAFAQAGLHDAQLYIVGSLRVASLENQQYLAELRRLAAGRPGVHLVESFVSDEEFDTWIAASDCVVLPYLEIWSSAVLARAKLFQRPAIVSAVGGLADQVSEHDMLVSSDAELILALQSMCESLRQNALSSNR